MTIKKPIHALALGATLAISPVLFTPQAQAETCVLDTDGDGIADGTGGATDNGGEDTNLACGTGATASGAIGAIAVGVGAESNESFTVAVGGLALASGENATAIGDFSTASAPDALAVGADSVASAEDSTAIGESSLASAEGATAIGEDSTATGVESVAIGENAFASGNNAIAIGTDLDTNSDGATAAGVGAVSIGADATAGFDNSVAIGQGAATTRANQISVGTATNTVTVAGITSAESRAAQSGPLELVTSDANGNLATDGGVFFSQFSGNTAAIATNSAAIERLREGTASIASIPDLYLNADETWALAGGISVYDDGFGGEETAFGGGFQLRSSTEDRWSVGVAAGISRNTQVVRLQARIGG
ncbi:MAG: hypothetical protein AAGL11_11300 [Pseudomonadota bacterium]